MTSDSPSLRISKPAFIAVIAIVSVVIIAMVVTALLTREWLLLVIVLVVAVGAGIAIRSVHRKSSPDWE